MLILSISSTAGATVIIRRRPFVHLLRSTIRHELCEGGWGFSPVPFLPTVSILSLVGRPHVCIEHGLPFGISLWIRLHILFLELTVQAL